MATYVIDGVRYKSNVPLTEEELEELSTPSEKPSYIAEAARKGIARFPSQVYGAFKGALAGTGQTGARAAVEEAKQGITGMLGGTGALPESQVQQILAGAVESAADPTSYILPGGALTSNVKGLMVPVAKAIESFMAGGGAEAGGIVGGIAGKRIGGETGEKIGRTTGALAGGIGGNLAAGTLPRLGTVATPVAGKMVSLISKIRGNEPLEAAEKAAESHIDKIFVSAAQADPNFVKVFEEAIKAQERTGIKIPLSSMMKDNAVINAYIGHLAAKYPQFRESFAEQFNEVQSALGAKSEKLFGRVGDADDFLLKSINTNKALFEQQSKSAGKRIAETKEQAGMLTGKIPSVEPAEFGGRASKAVDAAEASARSATSKNYDEAFKIADSKGVTLPSESVDDIYQTVVTGRNADIFATFPSIYAKVKSKFAPKEVEGSGVLDANGKPIAPATSQEFAEASVKDLDSLKREINLQLRNARTDSHVRVLQDLKSKVNEHIGRLDPDFVAAYRGADEAFLKRVGLPFNEETIKAIERSKFDENIVPLLTRNKSTVSQFIDTTGEQGKRLVEDAFANEMAKFVKDGAIDSAKAIAWLKSKKEALDVVPDVRDRLTVLVKDSDALINRAQTIQKNLDDAARSRVLIGEGGNAQAMVSSMYSNPQYLERVLRQTRGDKDATRAIQSFMLDDIITSARPLELLKDRTKGRVYEKVFGGYRQVLEDLALISDRITKDPSAVAASLKDIDADILTKMVGMRPERIVSLFATNPVVSKPVAAMTVINRFFNKKAGELAEERMMNLLLDREAGTRMLLAIKQAINKGESQSLAKFADWAKGRGYDFVDMLKKDAQSGAMRAYGGMDEGEIDRSRLEE